MTQLRTAVNAVRAAAGLAAASFTDPDLTTATAIRAVHLQEVRTALDAARRALYITLATYTDATVTAGTTPIKSVHLQQVRNGVK